MIGSFICSSLRTTERRLLDDRLQLAISRETENRRGPDDRQALAATIGELHFC